MTKQEIDRIECAIRHIQTAVDVDPWAAEIAVEALEKQIPMKIGSRVMDYMGRVKSECGNCGEIVEDPMWSYCPWCGQRIGEE